MNTIYKSETYLKDLEQSIQNTLGFSKLASKRILITGATGLVGSYIVDMLCLWNNISAHQQKIEVYACSRRIDNLKARFKGVFSPEYLHFAQQDMTQSLEIDFCVDYIIHAASNAYPAAYNQDPVGTMMGNILGTHELLEYAQENSVQRFMFISTGEVYGEGNRDSFDEDYSGYVNPMESRSCYPSAKRAAETLCASYKKQYGTDVVVARLCHTYGANVTASDNRATVQFLQRAVNNQDIILKSKGNQMRSYCYVGDCASGVLSVLTVGESGEAYNIANKNSRISIADFASIAAKQANVSVKYELPNELEKQERCPISRAVLSSQKIEKLGWECSFDPQTGIQHTLQISMDINN